MFLTIYLYLLFLFLFNLYNLFRKLSVIYIFDYIFLKGLAWKSHFALETSCRTESPRCWKILNRPAIQVDKAEKIPSGSFNYGRYWRRIWRCSCVQVFEPTQNWYFQILCYKNIKINFSIILLDYAVYEKDELLSNGSLYRTLNGNWSTFAPIIFMYERDTPQSNYISRELRKFYFDDEPINSANNRKLAEVHIRFSLRCNSIFIGNITKNVKFFFQVYADSIITFPMYRTARLFATYCRHPVYFYKFTFQGRRSFYMLNDTTPYGKMIRSFFVFKDYGAVLYFHERNWKRVWLK